MPSIKMGSSLWQRRICFCQACHWGQFEEYEKVVSKSWQNVNLLHLTWYVYYFSCTSSFDKCALTSSWSKIQIVVPKQSLGVWVGWKGHGYYEKNCELIIYFYRWGNTCLFQYLGYCKKYNNRITSTTWNSTHLARSEFTAFYHHKILCSSPF